MPAIRNGRKAKDRAARIYEQLEGARGLDDHERWQHALFFAMTPEERCRFSLKTARSALSLQLAKRLQARKLKSVKSRSAGSKARRK